MSLDDHHPETWIAIGYYCLKKLNKPSRTVYLAQKAYALDNTKIQALLLKGLALYKLKRYSDSLCHYKEAIRLIPFCFEGYKGIVDGYLATNRLTDASKFI
jgi:tetratricopeptide (TPR) repeat protein